MLYRGARRNKGAPSFLFSSFNDLDDDFYPYPSLAAGLLRDGEDFEERVHLTSTAAAALIIKGKRSCPQVGAVARVLSFM